VFLWTSQVARALADWCQRMFVILELARDGPQGRGSAWFLVTALFIFPFILLAPINGAISNGLPKRNVLVGAATFCLLVLAAITGIGDTSEPALLGTLLLVAVGSAIYNPTRYALLPAVAEDTGLPLTRVNGWIELGAAVGIIGGVIVAVQLQGNQWLGRPAALIAATGLSLLGALTAWPALFPSDVRRPEAPLRAALGFFRDTGRIWREPAARNSLLGLAIFLALITAGSGAVVMHALDPAGTAGARALPIEAMLLVSAGAAAGSWLAGREGDVRRALGLVAPASAGVLLALAGAALVPVGDTAFAAFLYLLLGITSGLANVPLRAALQAVVPADARGNAMAVTNFFIYVFTAVLSLLMVALARLAGLDAPWKQLCLLAGLAAVGTIVAGWSLAAQTRELFMNLFGARAGAGKTKPRLATDKVLAPELDR